MTDKNPNMRFDIDDNSNIAKADLSGLDVIVGDEDISQFYDAATNIPSTSPSGYAIDGHSAQSRNNELDQTLVYEPVNEASNYRSMNNNVQGAADSRYMRTYPSSNSAAPQPNKSTNYISSAPGPKRKKKHYFLKFLGILVAIGVAFAIFNVVSSALKSNEGWQSDYNGTWSVKAVSTSSNPVMSFAGSFFASSTTDVGNKMSIGINDQTAQANLFGYYSEYMFTFDKEHFRLMTSEGKLVFEGDYRFGFLVVTDKTTGSVTIYEKKSPSYEIVDIAAANQQPINAQELLDSARELSVALGGAGKDVLDNIDVDEFQQALDNVDPAELPHLMSVLTPDVLASGDISSRVDTSDPAMAQFVESISGQQVAGLQAGVQNGSSENSAAELNEESAEAN